MAWVFSTWQETSAPQGYCRTKPFSDALCGLRAAAQAAGGARGAAEEAATGGSGRVAGDWQERLRDLMVLYDYTVQSGWTLSLL